MIEIRDQKNARLTEPKKRAISILLLLLALAAVVIVSGFLENSPAGGPLNVYIASDPSSYCGFSVWANNSSRYAVTLTKGYEGILEAMESKKPDMALLPASLLSMADANDYSVAAVTSYLNLVAVQNGGTAKSIMDMNGKSVLLPDSVNGTPAYQMLQTLLKKTNVSLNIAFEKDEDLLKIVGSGNYDFMILPVKLCAQALVQNNGCRSLFNLASQWKALLGEEPPAGDLIVIKNECMLSRGKEVVNLLSEIKEDIGFLNDKHKKASQYISSLDPKVDPAVIYKMLPHMMFKYLEGDEMNASLQQLSLLTNML